MQHHDYTIGTIKNFDNWQQLRLLLGTVMNGKLTPSCICAGEEGWIISVRSAKRLTSSEVTWLQGYWSGFNHLHS